MHITGILCGRYFDDDEEAAANQDLEYIPAPGSPSADDSVQVSANAERMVTVRVPNN